MNNPHAHRAARGARRALAVNLRWYRDPTTISSAAVLAALLPVTVLCLAPIALLLTLLVPFGVPAWVWVLAYLAVIPVMMIPHFEFLQLWVVGRGSRAAMRHEELRLRDAWDTVLARAGASRTRRWKLRVMQADEINAAAAGGSVVMVTSYAVAHLSDQELQAVLAHELGHHVGLHPVVLLAQSWLIRPILWVDWVTVRLHNAVGWLMNLSRLHPVALVLLLAVQLSLRFVVLVLQLVVNLALGLLLACQRRAEYRADEVAVRLGYGPWLLHALHRFHEHEASRVGGFASWWTHTHPSTAQRIARIDQHMRRHGV